mgnify:CR=1 FL=1
MNSANLKGSVPFKSMKCPVCNSDIGLYTTYPNEETLSPVYLCSECGARLERKYGFTFFIIFLIVGAPIVNIFIGLMWIVFNDIVLSAYVKLDDNAFNTIDIILSGIAWLLLYFTFNKIEITN